MQDFTKALKLQFGATQDAETVRNKDSAKQEDLDCFIYGLRNPPEYRVSARNPKTLAEAVNIAIRLEGRDEAISHQEKFTNKTKTHTIS